MLRKDRKPRISYIGICMVLAAVAAAYPAGSEEPDASAGEIGISYDSIMAAADRFQQVKNQYRLQIDIANVHLRNSHPEAALDAMNRVLSIDIQNTPRREEFETYRKYVCTQMLEIAAAHGLNDRIPTVLKVIATHYPDDPQMQDQVRIYTALLRESAKKREKTAKPPTPAEEVEAP